MLNEVNYKELQQHANDRLCVALVYTSMCGTCENAKRMLTIVSEAVKSVHFTQINANLNQEVIKAYDITSVPCFLLFQNGILVDQFYAFHSVTFLFEKISQYTK